MSRPSAAVRSLLEESDSVAPAARLIYVSERLRLESAEADLDSFRYVESHLKDDAEVLAQVERAREALRHARKEFQALSNILDSRVEDVKRRARELKAEKHFRHLGLEPEDPRHAD